MSAVEISDGYYARNKRITQPNTDLTDVMEGFDWQELGSALDVGCGPGRNSRWLADVGVPRVVGLEPSPDVIVRLCRDHPDLEFIQADVSEELGGQYDLVVVCMALHWIPRRKFLSAVENIINATKKYLVVVDFTPHESFKVPFKHHPGLYTYHQDYRFVIDGFMEVVKQRNYNTEEPMEARSATLYRQC